MLVCDTHADTLYALSAPDRPAGGPLDVTAELLTAGGGVRVQCLALFVCTNGMRMSPTIVERELQAFEGLKQRGFCQITELSQAREGVANAMLTIEGGEAFGGDAAQVDRFADLGVRHGRIGMEQRKRRGASRAHRQRRGPDPAGLGHR